MKQSNLKIFIIKRIAVGIILGAPLFQTACLPGCEREYEKFQSLGAYEAAIWSVSGADDITKNYPGMPLHSMGGLILERKGSSWRSPLQTGANAKLNSNATIRLTDGCELYVTIDVNPIGLINRLSALDPKAVTRSRLLEDESVLDAEASISYVPINSNCSTYSKAATATLSIEEVNQSQTENWIVLRIDISAQLSTDVQLDISSMPGLHMTQSQREIGSSGDCS